jgi:protein gp37
MARTTIEWTECSWNPVTGCSKISAGCEHCYAERMAKRLKAMGQPRYRNGFEVTLHDDIIDSVVSTMRKAGWHHYQILTKRVERLVALDKAIDWPANTIVGGESGPGARPMQEVWALEIKRQAEALGIPFFFKQWGGFFKKRRGRLLEGREWNERPQELLKT